MKNRTVGAIWIVVAVILIFVVGFIPYFCMEREAFAQFGAGFGFMAAIFSGFAFLAVVWTLRTQLKALDDAREQHERQLAAAQTTARVQAFTILAELHRDLIQQALPDDQEKHRRQSEYYGSRALDLMRELDEKFPGDPQTASIGGYTDRQLAVSSLKRIVESLNGSFDSVREHPNNKAANNALAEAEKAVRQWIQRYRDVLDTEPIVKCMGPLGERRIQILEPTPELDEFWKKQDQTVTCLDEAVAEIEAAVAGNADSI